MKESTFYRAVGTATAAAGGVVASGVLIQRFLTERDGHRYPPLGSLVDVGGVARHVRTMGSGDGPTVLFESGMAVPLEVWSLVQERVATFAPTISYDRPGIGRSAPGPAPRTADLATRELHDMLDAVSATPPYVLVSHSYGGLLARYFAHRHPEEVAGMVLVDVSHPDQLSRSPRQQAGIVNVEQHLRDMCLQAQTGMIRLTANAKKFRLDELDDRARDAALAACYTAQMWKGSVLEFEAWTAHVNGEVRTAELPRTIPAIVLVASDTAANDPTHATLQREIAELFDDHEVRTIEGADHFNLVMGRYSHAIVTAIGDVVAAVRQRSSRREDVGEAPLQPTT